MTQGSGPTSDFRDVLYTIDKRGHRNWVYNAIVVGRFMRWRSAVMVCLLVVYLAMPWLIIGGEQAVFFDIPGRRFVIFGAVFWATDTIFLAILLGLLAIALFFFTAILGRVWCGWACPETVFLDFLFRPVERLIEGPPAERLRLDAAPWSARKVRIKLFKYLVFSILAWILASTFLAYFIGRETLITMMSHAPTANQGPFTLTLSMMGVMLFQFGWFREQFCTVVCPYARFQSVLMDANSLTVGYDARRGEPRGKIKRKEASAFIGDCVDCGLCVRVCPTGIDIRNGLQLECVACASCIDACDSVMMKLGRAPGLVRYATESGLSGKPTQFLRPRVLIYSAILALYIGVLGYRLTHRQYVDVQILRGGEDAPFTALADGRISNHLHLHLANKTKEPQEVRVSLVDSNGIELIMPANPFPLPPESLQTAPVFLNFNVSLLHDGKCTAVLRYDSLDGFSKTEQVTLIGPDVVPSSENNPPTIPRSKG